MLSVVPHSSLPFLCHSSVPLWNLDCRFIQNSNPEVNKEGHSLGFNLESLPELKLRFGISLQSITSLPVRMKSNPEIVEGRGQNESKQTALLCAHSCPCPKCHLNQFSWIPMFLFLRFVYSQSSDSLWASWLDVPNSDAWNINAYLLFLK